MSISMVFMLFKYKTRSDCHPQPQTSLRLNRQNSTRLTSPRASLTNSKEINHMTHVLNHTNNTVAPILIN